MSDLALDPITRDLLLDDDGESSLVIDADAVRQNWLIVIRTFLGDWFRNTDTGMDYFSLFEKPSDALRIRAAFVRATTLVAGVTTVVSMDVTLNPRLRTFAVTGGVKLATGQLVGLTFNEPIIGKI